MRELRQEWNDFWFGLAMGAVGPRGPELTMREDIQILLVEEAVTVALQIGEKDGWGRSTWEDLLQELIDMEEEPA